MPVNRFWDSIGYCISRNFLGNFSDAELEDLPIDADSDASYKDKIELLLRLLREKAAQEEAAAAPTSLHQLDYVRWNRLWQAICAIQQELDLPEAEDTLRMLVDKAEDSNVVPRHMLADYLVKVGKYVEAEETERPICAWMDAQERLGKASPQALNARRIIARALWMQGPSRRAEAEALVAEIKAITENMANGRFAVYQEEERSLTEEMMTELEKAG